MRSTHSHRNGIIQGTKFRKMRVYNDVFTQGLYPHNFSELRELPEAGDVYEAEED